MQQQQQQQQQVIPEIRGFPRSWAAPRRGKQSREKEPARATLGAQSTRYGVQPGPASRTVSTHAALHAPQREARAKTRGRRISAWRRAKKVKLALKHTWYYSSY